MYYCTPYNYEYYHVKPFKALEFRRKKKRIFFAYKYVVNLLLQCAVVQFFWVNYWQKAVVIN